MSLAISLRFEGGQAQVVRLRLVEGVSRTTRAEIELSTDEHLDVSAAAGGPAALTLSFGEGVSRTWNLIVGDLRFDRDAGTLRYRCEAHSPFWLLGHTKDTRKYRNMSARDIVTDVLSRGGIEHRWEIQREPEVRKYCTQYRESNRAFVERLLEFEGIYHWDDAGVLVLSDTSSGAPELEGETRFDLLESGDALSAGEMGMLRFGVGARPGSGKATVNDFNWKTPQVPLLSTASGDRDTELETYDYPAGYRRPDQGAALASRRLEAHRARTSFRCGRSNVVTLCSGRRFAFEGEGGGDLFVTEVEHEATAPGFMDSDQGSYQNRFEAIPAPLPFRPAVVTPVPKVPGCHTAMVRGPEGEEIHTDKYGRFRGQFHWDREATGTDRDSRWLRKLQESATSINLARVGWEICVGYIAGDPDRPIGLTRVINGKMPPIYGQPDNKKTMTIRTPTYPGGGGYNEIKLDDTAGAMRFDVRAERDLRGHVEHDRTETVGRDEQHQVDDNLDRAVARHQEIDIGKNQRTEVGNDRRWSVETNRSDGVSGSESVDVANSRSVSVGGNDRESVGSLRLTIAGGVSTPDPAAAAKGMAPSLQGAAQGAGQAAVGALESGGGLGDAASAAKGNLKSMVPSGGGLAGGLGVGNVGALFGGRISRGASDTFTRMVGGVHLQASGEIISDAATYLHAETIGGAKVSLCPDGNIAQQVGGPMALTVGGAIFRKSGADMGVGGKSVKVSVGGLAQLVSDERIEIKGRAVKIEAQSALDLKQEDLALTLEKESLTVKGKLRVEAEERVVVSGDPDNITKAAE